MFANVLVGVDGEQGGRDALALAAQLADPDATISLVNVFGAGLMPGKGAALLLRSELEQSGRLLEREREAAAPAAKLIPCADRSIGHALHVLAERHGADLIVVGASRHGFIGRILLGNDTAATLAGAPCAVAVAPSGYADNPSEDVHLQIVDSREDRPAGRLGHRRPSNQAALPAQSPLLVLPQPAPGGKRRESELPLEMVVGSVGLDEPVVERVAHEL